MLRLALAPWSGLLLAACMGCNGKSPVDPGALATPIPQRADRSGSLTHFVGGRWQLTADGAGVAIEALPARAAQTPDQGRLFHLDIGQFMRPRDLEIRAFRYNGDGNLQVDYAVHHPFPAPDLTQPPGGKNRSDLGFTGQLLILADVPAAQVASHTYFPGVVANTEAVVDADGYVNPGDLLFRDTAQWATAFPYKLVVDEARDNREGVGNDGRPTGNYDPTRGGWQAFNIDEFGVKNGWTGYDFLHQGQTVRGSFTLDRRILAQPGGFRVQLAVLIKYQDPKGTVPSVDPYVRFPQTDPVDIHKFCYRVPFGALDASKVDLAPAEGFLSTGVGTMATLDVKVRDWDATAPIAANNPGDDPNLNSVQFGADGRPAVDAGIPTLGDSPFPSLPLVGGNGEPGAELRYRVYVTNNKGNAPAGTVTGLIRATDPEQSVNGRELYTFGIDPNTLAPDPARRLDAITYQRVTLALPAHQGYADSLPGSYGNGDPAGTFTDYDPGYGAIGSGLVAGGDALYHVALNRGPTTRKLMLNISPDGGETWSGAQEIFTLFAPPTGYDVDLAPLADGDLLFAMKDGGTVFAIVGRPGPGGTIQWQSSFKPVNPAQYVAEDVAVAAHPTDPAKAIVAVTHLEGSIHEVMLYELTVSDSSLEVEWWTEAESAIGMGYRGHPALNPHVAIHADGALHVAYFQAENVFYTAKPAGGSFLDFPEVVANDAADVLLRPRALIVSGVGVPYLLYSKTEGGVPNAIVARRDPFLTFPASWTRRTLDPGPINGVAQSAMAIDPATGALYFTWERMDTATASKVMYSILPPTLGTPILAPLAINPDTTAAALTPWITFSRPGGMPQATILFEGAGTAGSHEVSVVRIGGS